jgi:hypothetical protein
MSFPMFMLQGYGHGNGQEHEHELCEITGTQKESVCGRKKQGVANNHVSVVAKLC